MFRQVFDPENLFWRLISRGVDFVGLSLFWIALCLPVVTIGPATAALYYTVVKVFRHKRGRGLRHVLALLCAESAPGHSRHADLSAGDGAAVLRLSGHGGQRGHRHGGGDVHGLYYVVLLVPVGMFCYLFPIMGRFEMGLGSLFRTSLLLALRHLPSTVVIVLLTVQMVAFGVRMWWPVFFAPVLTTLLVSLFLERIFPKYLNEEERAALEDRPPEEERSRRTERRNGRRAGGAARLRGTARSVCHRRGPCGFPSRRSREKRHPGDRGDKLPPGFGYRMAQGISPGTRAASRSASWA